MQEACKAGTWIVRLFAFAQRLPGLCAPPACAGDKAENLAECGGWECEARTGSCMALGHVRVSAADYSGEPNPCQRV